MLIVGLSMSQPRASLYRLQTSTFISPFTTFLLTILPVLRYLLFPCLRNPEHGRWCGRVFAFCNSSTPFMESVRNHEYPQQLLDVLELIGMNAVKGEGTIYL